MKTFLSILVLAAIVFAYVISASFYAEGQIVLAYSLILSAITSLVFWIKANDLLKTLAKA